MDEVYNDLLQYEVALEEKNAALEESHQFIESGARLDVGHPHRLRPATAAYRGSE